MFSVRSVYLSSCSLEWVTITHGALDLSIQPYPTTCVKPVQLGPQHTAVPQTCSTYSAWTSLYMDSPNMFKRVQLGPHWKKPPQHVQTCSTWASLYMDPLPPTRCSNLLTMKPRLSASEWLASYWNVLFLLLEGISILPDKCLCWGSWVVMGKWQLVTSVSLVLVTVLGRQVKHKSRNINNKETLHTCTRSGDNN